MLISSIESLISKDREYMEFYQWIMKEDEKIEAELKKIEPIDTKRFKTIMHTFSEEYFKIFSSRRNIIDFFENHLSKENNKSAFFSYLRFLFV